MKTYTITQQTIRQLHELGDDKVKAVLKDEFGDAFFPEVGKWYWFLLDQTKESLIFVESIKQEQVFFYGFVINGSNFLWREKDWYNIDNHYELATEEEVKSTLVKEAEKRGFGKTGVAFNNPFGEEKEISSMNGFDFWNLRSNCVDEANLFNISVCRGEGGVIFHQGKWATILPQIPAELQQLIEKHGKAELLKYLK